MTDAERQEMRAMVQRMQALLDKATPDVQAPAPLYVDADAVAATYRVSRRTVHAWVAEGCPHLQRGRIVRFEPAAVDAWFRGRPAAKLQRVR